MSKHSIQAQIANGEVARVIHHDDEETWVLNFKKAMLDSLQVDTSLKKAGEREGYSLKVEMWRSIDRWFDWLIG